jgi:hypothetical protein
MKKANVWDLSNKKWLYWCGEIGSVIALIVTGLIPMTIIYGLIYLIFDRDRPKTKDYKIERVTGKFVIVIGNLVLALIALWIVIVIMIPLLFGMVGLLFEG